MKLKIAILLMFLSTILSLNAQKLPAIQEVAIRVPADVKIDGKLDEWGKKLQAFNKNTLIYYAIANDDENLYLIIQVDDVDIINKVISGAITLTVNNLATKSDEKFPTISFPLLNPTSGAIIRNNLKSKNLAVDSLLLANNNELSNGTKEIKFSDINEITDTISDTHTKKFQDFRWYPLFILPGYYLTKDNSLGIKAAAGFEGHWKYNYELSVPLKYLKVTPGKKFTYNIRLNGPMYKTKKPTAGYPVRYVKVNGHFVQQDLELTEATDFWGEYTLAKKP